ncbi:SapC family protein [Asticcacaulis sp. SL142]|uniref:SapC family protein n=1 Tax=Asticcacaulis sp. SL142 TaxID=2995155 RepID=UPI00226D37AF|nr:SapC family protein [Asticcacaulis sp. SL142]WAC49186.1 SapC family protein [Asticcacaulis sp. SL142]
MSETRVKPDPAKAEPQTSKSTAVANLALFYKNPQPLSAQLHGHWRLREGNVGFAADTAYIPVTLSEFALVVRDYPLLFAQSTAAPLALLGLERQNLFVSDGMWEDHAYIPAYVRRYPFSTIRLEDDKGFAMVVDTESERLVKDPACEDGVALFDLDEPSSFTRQVMDYCEAFHREALATQAFSEALKAQDILVDRRADLTLPDGKILGIDGFCIVDAERFSKLDDHVIVDWHRKGWLGLISFHLASLERFSNLMKRNSARRQTLSEPITNAKSKKG